MRAALLLSALAFASVAINGGAAEIQNSSDSYVPRPKGSLTFNKDVAPIIFQRCSVCHRPGQAAPFELLGYSDVQKRAKQIVEVTQKRIMPPWLPDPSYVHFAGERRLNATELGTLQQWASEDMAEGSAVDLPPRPEWPGGWLLGKPDLVVTMPEAYSVPAESPDIYRNFVIPIPLTQARYIRAEDMNPGNFKVVHHAFIKFDQTHESRRQDQKDSEPGFSGMPSKAKMPDGHFLTWQPGRMPAVGGGELAWLLEPGMDLMLEMHLRASGKPEKLQSAVAFYFAEKPPTQQAFKSLLTSLTLDIPAGATNYIVEDHFDLPIGVELTAILPHAHFLARRMEGWAVLPNGRKEPLLRINDWDFNWQGDYHYERPVRLPKGSSIWMRYTYDNSTNNVRNPSFTPRRVRYGPQSNDEMAELWFQFVAPLTNDLSALSKARDAKMTKVFRDSFEYQLRENPRDASTHSEFGLLLYQTGQWREAIDHFHTATSLKPDFDEPHYYLGLLYRRQNRLAEAETEFKTAIRLNPEHAKAHGNLGFIYVEQGKSGPAEEHLKAAVALNPDDRIATQILHELSKAKQ